MRKIIIVILNGISYHDVFVDIFFYRNVMVLFFVVVYIRSGYITQGKEKG